MEHQPSSYNKKIKFACSASHEQLYTEVLHSKYDVYHRILNQTQELKFWDVVVLTCFDDMQKQLYEYHIKDKVRQGSIPASCDYLVVADPPGPKVGNGGATLAVLDSLKRKYSNNFDQLKVMVCHAGGFSKRLPNHALTGKIFAPMPYAPFPQFSNTAWPTMMEMKLILFVDFPQRMRPGVFITCADDIELFDSRNSDFTSPGFTALAHPSTLQVGTGHGVFVLNTEQIYARLNNPSPEIQTPVQCLKFMHKPTVEMMKEAGAIVEHNEDQQVFTDSNYFFDMEIAGKLVDFYRNHGVKCEVDAYGDFLHPLGELASDDYFTSSRTTGSAPSSELINVRKKLFSILKGTHFNVIPYVPSLFVHIGTAREYLEHLCFNLPKFGFNRFHCNAFLHSADKLVVMPELGLRADVDMTPKKRKLLHSSVEQKRILHNHCCMMYNILGENVTVGHGSVVEYCRITPEHYTNIGNGSILSNVHVPATIVEIPSGIFLHTMTMATSTGHQYVTVLYGLEDNLKDAASDSSQLNLWGEKLSVILQHLSLADKDLWPDPSVKKSLWTACLFPRLPDPRDSSQKMFDLINVIQNHGTVLDWSQVPRVSMNDAVTSECKNLQAYLHYHETHMKSLVAIQLRHLFLVERYVKEWLSRCLLLSGLLTTLSHDTNPNNDLEALVEEIELVVTRGLSPLEMSRALFSFSILMDDFSSFFTNQTTLDVLKKLKAEFNQRSALHLRQIFLEPFMGVPQHVGISIPPLLQRTNPTSSDSCTVTLPARLNLAGGWSDTPPYALDCGGAVLNVAICVDGQLPIQATARFLPEPVFRMVSSDTYSSLVPQDTSCVVSSHALQDMFTYSNPDADPFALHKACLCLLLFPSVCMHPDPRSSGYQKADEIRRNILGERGLELITEVHLPRGSGLGTSSILALACIRALRQLFGANSGVFEQHTAQATQEYNAVLAVEQMLSTGGGWQDQIGGGVQGLKLIQTEAGPRPEYNIHVLPMSKKLLQLVNDRLVLVYTGRTRMAKSVLYNVIDHWRIREPGMTAIFQQIKDVSHHMFAKMQMLVHADSLLQSDPDKAMNTINNVLQDVGEMLNRVYDLQLRKLEKKFTNQIIEDLRAAMEPFVSGSHIMGAGQGGFLFGFLKPQATKQGLSVAVKKHSAEAGLTTVEFCYAS